MLCAICVGQPSCRAIHPSQTVAVVSEKHITANQSSEFTIPRRRVGSANAARMAAGTAMRLYSGSNGSARNSMITNGHSRNMNGIEMWGAVSHDRQRQRAKRAKGQVSQRNQAR